MYSLLSKEDKASRKAFLADMRLRRKGRHPEQTHGQTLKTQGREFLNVPEGSQYKVFSKAKKDFKKDFKRVFREILRCNRHAQNWAFKPREYFYDETDDTDDVDRQPGQIKYSYSLPTYMSTEYVKNMYYCIQYHSKPNAKSRPYKKRAKRK